MIVAVKLGERALLDANGGASLIKTYKFYLQNNKIALTISIKLIMIIKGHEKL